MPGFVEQGSRRNAPIKKIHVELTLSHFIHKS